MRLCGHSEVLRVWCTPGCFLSAAVLGLASVALPACAFQRELQVLQRAPLRERASSYLLLDVHPKVSPRIQSTCCRDQPGVLCCAKSNSIVLFQTRIQARFMLCIITDYHFAVLWMEPRVSCMPGTCCVTELLPREWLHGLEQAFAPRHSQCSLFEESWPLIWL